MNRLKAIIAREQGRFILVGILNTLIGAAAMFIAYNVFHLGYWLSSAMDYIIGSIFSFFANKYFTFRSLRKSEGELVRFAVNIAACYFLAYSAARPMMAGLLTGIRLSASLLDQLSMVSGMCIFVALNYFGQKFFVFRTKKRPSGGKQPGADEAQGG